MANIDPTIAALLEAMREDREAARAAQERQTQLITDLLAQLTLPRNRGNRAEDQPIGNNEFENEETVNRPVREPKWDSRLRVEIPDFTGSLNSEEYLDWVYTVEEVFKLKNVPPEKQVSLVAIRFRDRAAAWWQNYKYQRYQDRLLPLEEWGDLKRAMDREFLPLNYKQTLFKQFQALTQGSKSVDEYTLEFYKLAARNQLNETEDQRVARYMQGLRGSIQDALIAHTFYSVSEVQAKAKAVEQHHSRNRPFMSRAQGSSSRTPGDNSKWNSPSDKVNTSSGTFPSGGQ
jgi:hypothetical protein